MSSAATQLMHWESVFVRGVRRSAAFALLLSLGGLTSACGSEDAGPGAGTGGSAAGTGASGGGGGPSGGATASGGTGGTVASGGTPSSGGTGGSGIGGSGTGGFGTGGIGTGGIGTGGIGTGGIGTGGAGNTGGAAGSGGVAGSGGMAGSGGAPAFDPCPQAEPCKILPLGDSITDGFGVPGGYRIELFRKALDAGQSITFVGRAMNGPDEVDGQPFPRAHEGYSGWTIQQIDDIVPSPALDADPHIVLLHLGTNDMAFGANGADQRLAALIDQILSALPDALLVVSSIIPFPGNNNISAYNAAIPGIVEARANAGKHILFVDQFTDFPEDGFDDPVHPDEKGYAYMATVWYTAISSYLR